MPRANFSAPITLGLQNSAASAGLTDLLVHEIDGEAFLYATTRAGGQVSTISLGGASGQAALLTSTVLSPVFTQLVDVDLAARHTADGVQLLFGGLFSDMVQGFELDVSGAGLGEVQNAVALGTEGFDAALLRELALTADGTTGLAALQSGALVQLDFAGSQVTSTQIMAGPQGVGGHITELLVFTDEGATFALATRSGLDQLDLLRLDGGQFSHETSVNVGDGVWFNAPGALAVADVGDTTYVVVAGQDSNSLTVFALDATGGTLTPVDHVLDTSDTRFSNPSQLEAFEVNGRSFLVASGDDAGLTVFEVLPEGRLHIVTSVAGSVDSPLTAISALEVVATASGARIFVATQSEPFLVEYDFNFSDLGPQITAAAGGGTVNGAATDDSLIGLDGNDTLHGGAGSDVLVDGAGEDTLWGGDGADTFILTRDGDRDRIMDFEIGVDRLDLTSLSALFDPNNIGVSLTSYGAELFVGGEVIELHVADGGALQLSDLGLDAFVGIDRVVIDPGPLVPPSGSPPHPEMPDAPDVAMFMVAPTFPNVSTMAQTYSGDGQADPITLGAGNDIVMLGRGADTADTGGGDDMIDGGAGNDTIFGGSGDDLIFGGVGFDVLEGGAGNDRLDGGSFADLINGGDGDDLIVGGAGFDNLNGGAGNDQLWGGTSPDRLSGGDGDDVLRAGSNFGWTVDGLSGGAGDDMLFGEAGFDLLDGGDGDDLLFGGAQADTLLGGAGADWLDGGAGFDRLFAGAGNDTLVGGQGTDALFGQWGDDLMSGGTERDRLWGGPGNDVLWGDSGDDELSGGSGFDWIDGGTGDDVMSGNFNADTFAFASGHGHDTVRDFDARNDLERIDLTLLDSLNNFDAVLAAAEQVGGDVLINTGDDSTILLLGVQLSDLDALDFIF